MGYTLWYTKTYDEWVEEKARRVQKVLMFFYQRELPIDFQMLASKVYRERLSGISKTKWMPLNNRFLDKKPSPFIKNFINYLISELVDRGYVTPPPEITVRTVPPLNVLKEICKWTDPCIEELYQKEV